MKEITICTANYIQEITDFYYCDIQDFVNSEGYLKGEYFLKINEDKFEAKPLVELMQDIILEKNVIISGRYKLFKIFKALLFLNDNEKMCSELTQFIKETKRLNIEGYICFRLSLYERRLCKMLYSVIKRNLKIEYR